MQAGLCTAARQNAVDSSVIDLVDDDGNARTLRNSDLRSSVPYSVGKCIIQQMMLCKHPSPWSHKRPVSAFLESQHVLGYTSSAVYYASTLSQHFAVGQPGYERIIRMQVAGG